MSLSFISSLKYPKGNTNLQTTQMFKLKAGTLQQETSADQALCYGLKKVRVLP